jgi:hypothetical protein
MSGGKGPRLGARGLAHLPRERRPVQRAEALR